MRIHLAPADRERYGLGPEPIPVDIDGLSARQAIAFQRATGWTVERLETGLQGKLVRGSDGQPIYITDDEGEYVRDADGRRTAVRETDLEAVLALVWLALWRAGHTIDFDELDFDIVGTSIEADDEPGKD